MDHIIPAEFHGTSLSIIDRDGQKWLTAEEVGRCLGYNDANVRKGISKLYNAHVDEFTAADTCVVDLATQVQSRAMRIFSSTGCIKLGFFASTPRAKEFRNWASSVLAAQPAPAIPADPLAIPGIRFILDGNRDMARELGQLKDLVAAQSSMVLGLYQQLDGARRGHLRAQSELLAISKRQAAADAKALVLELEAVGCSRDEIVRRTGKTFNHVRQIIFKAKQGERQLGEAA